MELKQKRAVLTVGAAFFASAGLVRTASAQAFATAGQAQAAPESSTQSSGETRATAGSRADAYFNYTMGHIAEQQFEATSRSEYATQAIEYYKKAYALDPKSPVIGERLAEMYWKANRVREAESEAQGLLKRDPNDVQTRRLLGHIYLRSLGEANGNGQSEAVTRAVEQFREVVRLDPADTESALWLARLYRLQNKHEQAEGVLRGILKNEPDNEAGVEQLTQLLLDQGKSSEAVALLESVTGKTSSPTLLDLLGDAYTQTKDLAKAEAAYRKATELDPSELSHQRGLGQTLLAEEKYPEALKVYQRLEDLMPDDADVYLHLAKIYREMHQLDKAEETLTKARQYLPDSLDVMYNEAMLYQTQGRSEDAIQVLSDAVRGVKGQSEMLPTRRRNLAVLYQQLGKLYSETENYQAAVNTYGELGHLGEDEDRRARLLLMETYRSAKDLPKALQTGKEALAKYPADSSIKSSYALLLGEEAHTEEALALLKPQLKGTDGDRDVYLNIAQVYERARKYKEAEQSARTAEALPGAPRENEMTWFLLGAIYERQKFYDRAEVEFKKVLAVDPQNAAALNYYGYMLGDLGIRLDEAETMVKKALAEDAYNGAYLDSLGWIYYKQGKYTEAEVTLRKAVERESHDPTIHSHLGDVYAKLGRMEMAAMQWDKSLEEWRRVLPADVENDKIAEVEKKVNQSKHRVAQKATPNAAQPK
ncbi:MAG TPA: tetratricopeptide repeat protein [Candidatus Dormibacteraeota bacterium]|jgi:tetratricopeptide (TPR) repeat protein|nr:tetratricopeptide repeat protein [Candidatus Dormibacteraeota bacterium]